MRDLTTSEIEMLASKPHVKRIAVENFLGTLDTSIGYSGNARNARMDAQLYKWNQVTLNAILAGIMLSANNKPPTRYKL